MERWPKIYHFWSMLGYNRCTFFMSSLRFIPKVKLDGVNTGIHIKPNGEWFAQSRNSVITSDNDLHGFASWANQYDSYWHSLSKKQTYPFTIFGEWYGEGIQTGSTASKVTGRHWGIFAINNKAHNVFDSLYALKPHTLHHALPNLPDNAFIIPTFASEDGIDNIYNEIEVSEYLSRINELVNQVAEKDPVLENRHGIIGPGEGLVFFNGKESQSQMILSPKEYIFKAKPDKHQVIKDRENKMAINVRTIPEFADYMLTEERLMQCAQSVAQHDYIFDEKLIGPFVAGILKDVKKEAKPIVESNGVRWRSVSKEVSKQAKEWYINMLESYTVH